MKQIEAVEPVPPQDGRSDSVEQVNVRLHEEPRTHLDKMVRCYGSTRQEVVAEAIELLWAHTTSMKHGILNESELLAVDLLLDNFRNDPSPGLAVYFVKTYAARLSESLAHWWRAAEGSGIT